MPPLVINPPTYTESLWQPFKSHHAALGGAPGNALSKFPERIGSGRRVRYQNGTIYERPDGRCAWVYGAIGDRYHQLGGPTSWLGFPTSDELPVPDAGRLSHFDNGDIYWWPDVGAIELNEVIVHYTGLFCFGETDHDQFTPEDEPYVILGTVATTGGTHSRSMIYEDVDDGESRPDVIEIYRGKPSGIALTALLMEHDEDDPDKYKRAMQEGVNAGFQAACTAVGAGGFCSAPVIGDILKVIADAIGKLLSDLLDLDDDKLGLASIALSQKQMVVLAARTPNSVFQGIGYKVESPLLGASEGASYKVYFGLVTA